LNPTSKHWMHMTARSCGPRLMKRITIPLWLVSRTIRWAESHGIEVHAVLSPSAARLRVRAALRSASFHSCAATMTCSSAYKSARPGSARWMWMLSDACAISYCQGCFDECRGERILKEGMTSNIPYGGAIRARNRTAVQRNCSSDSARATRQVVS
jgi:hypothetical protein